MALLMIKELPRYECLLEASREFPDLDPSATEAFLHLLRSGDEALRVVDEHLAKHDLTQGRFGVLMALWTNCRRDGDGGALSPAEIAGRMGVTRATISGLLDALERDGLVTRMPHSDDRRMSSVAITPRAEELLRSLMPEHFRQMAWLMSPLDDSERRTLVGLLIKILRRAAERPSAAESDSAELAQRTASRGHVVSLGDQQ